MKAIFENHKIPYQFQDNLRIEFSLIFMTFSASISTSIFSSNFNGKWLQNGPSKRLCGGSFWHPFRDLFRSLIFGCILVTLWLTLGSLLAPFGSLLAPFGVLLAPFGFLLAPFGSLLAHFGFLLAHFWRLLAHF